MGIPFYYGDLIKKYPDIIEKPFHVNILFFDYNHVSFNLVLVNKSTCI